MLAFAFEGSTYRRERLGQRKDFGGDEHIGVRGSDRMPVDAFCRDGNLRCQISARKSDAFHGETPQRDPADHPILVLNLVCIEEATELLSLAIIGDGGRQSNPEPFPASSLNTLPGAQPGARSPMAVMKLRRRTVEADLQRQAIAWQRTERLQPPPPSSIPLVSTVVGAAAMHEARISPISVSRKGSPPVTKISPTPILAASLVIRRTRERPSSLLGTLGEERTQQ